MGRPRKYEGDAREAHNAAVRAHRERTAGKDVPIEREALLRLEAAVEAAAGAGDADALLVRGAYGSSLLRNLALLFERRAGRE